jgi:hypothetical protein
LKQNKALASASTFQNIEIMGKTMITLAKSIQRSNCSYTFENDVFLHETNIQESTNIVVDKNCFPTSTKENLDVSIADSKLLTGEAKAILTFAFAAQIEHIMADPTARKLFSRMRTGHYFAQLWPIGQTCQQDAQLQPRSKLYCFSL